MGVVSKAREWKPRVLQNTRVSSWSRVVLMKIAKGALHSYVVNHCNLILLAYAQYSQARASIELLLPFRYGYYKK